jgi:hypothetical protein
VFPVKFIEPEGLVAQNGGSDPGGPQTVGAGQHEGPDHEPSENLMANLPDRQGYPRGGPELAQKIGLAAPAEHEARGPHGRHPGLDHGPGGKSPGLGQIGRPGHETLFGHHPSEIEKNRLRRTTRHIRILSPSGLFRPLPFPATSPMLPLGHSRSSPKPPTSGSGRRNTHDLIFSEKRTRFCEV